jgi:hypothetical protein
MLLPSGVPEALITQFPIETQRAALLTQAPIPRYTRECSDIDRRVTRDTPDATQPPRDMARPKTNKPLSSGRPR